jgi:hypothetical protein
MNDVSETVEDPVEVELAQLYRERERLQFAAPKTAIRAERVREHRERLEAGIARLEAMRP